MGVKNQFLFILFTVLMYACSKDKTEEIANQNSNSLSVINVLAHVVTSTISLGQSPSSIAIKP